MRAYFFTNYYMSSIQKGIQALHCVSDMFVYRPNQMLDVWAGQHKTAILLNGGNSGDLQEIYEALDTIEHDYPYAMFNEDEQSLNNAVTCVGIVLPEKVYFLAEALRKSKPEEILAIERDLFFLKKDEDSGFVQKYEVAGTDLVIARLISSCPLAN